MAAVPKYKFEECSGAEGHTNLNVSDEGKQVEANRKSQSKKRACFLSVVHRKIWPFAEVG